MFGSGDRQERYKERLWQKRLKQYLYAKSADMRV